MTGEDKSVSPGDVVLAKVKGYAPWPAMVLSDESLPEGVLAARPKNRPEVHCVRFFVDSTYAWNSLTDLKPLSPEDATAYLEKKKSTKRDKSLNAAYEVAANPPSLDEFLKQIQEPPAPKKRARKIAADDKAEPKRQKKAAATGSAASSDTTTASSGAKGRTKKSNKDKDNDNDKADENANGDEKGDDKKREDLAFSSHTATREKQVYQIRIDLQKKFLGSEKPQQSDFALMDRQLSLLEHNSDLEVSIIRKTRVNKVLKMIAKMTDIPGENDYHFASRARALVDRWSQHEPTPDAGVDSDSKDTKKATSGAASNRSFASIDGDTLSDDPAECEKQVLGIRHRFQRAFLNGKSPNDEDLPIFDRLLTVLEKNAGHLDPALVKLTSINKVMKMLAKRENVPGDEKYSFTTRARSLLDKWTKDEANNDTANDNGETVKPKTEDSGNGSESKAEDTNGSDSKNEADAKETSNGDASKPQTEAEPKQESKPEAEAE
uniref:ARAD1A13156p n=1 Tax=Blastobotrys adeninivorans TaxID=409370 RepID=A0A060T3Z5_BLAAD